MLGRMTRAGLRRELAEAVLRDVIAA